MSDDRTVHAITAWGAEIVRYDRAGKWYAEAGEHREHLTFASAVELAKRSGSSLRLGRPGGSRFDAAVTRDWPVYR